MVNTYQLSHRFAFVLTIFVIASPLYAQSSKPLASQGTFQWLGEHGKHQMVVRVVISPDGQWAASSSLPREGKEEPGIFIWNMVNGKLHASIKGKDAYSFSPDSKKLLYFGKPGDQFTFHYWDFIKQQDVISFEASLPVNIRKALFSPDGQSVYLIGAQADEKWIRGQIDAAVPFDEMIKNVQMNGYLAQWDLSSGKLIRQLILPEFKLIHDAAFTRDQKELALGGQLAQEEKTPAAQLLMLLDVPAWKSRRTLIQGDFGYVKRLAYVEDDRQLLVLGSSNGEILFVSCDERNKLVRKIAHRPYGPAFDMALAPGQQFVVTAQNMEIKGLIGDLGRRKVAEVVLWNYQTGAREHQVKELGLSAICLAVAPDAHGILFGTIDGRVGLWRWKEK